MSRGWFENVLTHHRGLFATVFLLPVSVLLDAYMAVRNELVFRFGRAPAEHERNVQNVIRQIEDWPRQGCRVENHAGARIRQASVSAGVLP